MPQEIIEADTRNRLRDLIRSSTRPASPPLLPELRHWAATDCLEIWSATETALERLGIAPPFWAFAWPGGQALGRWLLDNPAEAAGRRVLALAAGAGLEALAAARAGAAAAVVNDVDPAALAAAELNAELNGAALGLLPGDLGEIDVDAISPRPDLVLIGDAFYEHGLAERLAALLERFRRRGARILIGDPGRGFPPEARLGASLQALAEYDVATDIALEDRASRRTRVLAFAA